MTSEDTKDEAKPGPKGTTSGPKANSGAGGLDVKRVRLAIGGLVAVAIVVVLAVALLGGDDGSSGVAPIASDGTPVGFSESDLTAQGAELPHAAYWVGPKDDATDYELTLTPDGLVYVRYLTGGASVGDQRPDFLTIGSYPLPDAAAALKTAAAHGNQTLTDQDGYETLTGGGAKNAYVVFDDQPDVQVEVYSPMAGEADDLVSSGAVVPLD